VPSALGAGTIPKALAGAVQEVAAAGLAMARQEIDAGEFAARSCESTLQTALVWACGAVGQSVIPVPVVGALVGGFVGQHSATVIVQGLHQAVAAAREDGLEEARVALLEAEAAAAVETAVLLSEAERALGRP
jgi:phage tail tape-measure protein